MDIYSNGKKIDTMYPERRFYKASEQTATMVANRSHLHEDLYLVYTGSSDTGQADYQGARESAGHVDLDRRVVHHRRDRHRARANMQTVRVMAPVRATSEAISADVPREQGTDMSIFKTP